MRLKITCLALLVSVAACLGMAAGATAASSPTATATAATKITTTSAVIHATINPNGAKTTYYFSYGSSSALGTAGPQHSLAAGSKTKSVTDTVSDLSSGTTYYYNLTAVNAAGTSGTKTLTFKTTGHPPAQALTGAATVDSSSSVTLTGTVNTQDVSTSYYFVYGTTTSYGSATATQTASPSTSPTAVSYTLTGLAPGTVFYYALVAGNGPNDGSEGTPGNVETWPNPVPTPGLVASTTPKHAAHNPYVVTTTGRIVYTNKTSRYLACAGAAEVSYYYGSRLIDRQAVPTDVSNCSFVVTTEFKGLPVKGHSSEQLKVYARFNGNHYFKAVILKPQTITLG